MSVWHTHSVWAMAAAFAALLALSWTSAALAQSSPDADDFDGDDLALPILLGVGVLAYLGWAVVRAALAQGTLAIPITKPYT